MTVITQDQSYTLHSHTTIPYFRVSILMVLLQKSLFHLCLITTHCKWLCKDMFVHVELLFNLVYNITINTFIVLVQHIYQGHIHYESSLAHVGSYNNNGTKHVISISMQSFMLIIACCLSCFDMTMLVLHLLSNSLKKRKRTVLCAAVVTNDFKLLKKSTFVVSGQVIDAIVKCFE